MTPLRLDLTDESALSAALEDTPREDKARRRSRLGRARLRPNRAAGVTCALRVTPWALSTDLCVKTLSYAPVTR